jgi:hypothetical protein
MPRPTLKIVASQRDALYEQVRNHLAGLGDVVVALECQKDYATAERLAIEFGEDFRLMADLGWQPQDGRDTVELTMPPHDLMEVAKRLRDEAHGGPCRRGRGPRIGRAAARHQRLRRRAGYPRHDSRGAGRGRRGRYPCPPRIGSAFVPASLRASFFPTSASTSRPGR